MLTLKNVRMAYDGTQFCNGPMPGSVYTELMINDTEKQSFVFILVSEFMGDCMVDVTSLPIFDLLHHSMLTPPDDFNYEENADPLIEKVMLKRWEINSGEGIYLDNEFRHSRYAKPVLLALEASRRFAEAQPPEGTSDTDPVWSAQQAAAVLEQYRDADLQKLEVPLTDDWYGSEAEGSAE